MKSLLCPSQKENMRLLILTLCSTLLSAAVVSNAYYKKQQFYLTIVYLLKSNSSIGVLYLQAFVLVWLSCKFIKKLFFGTLRAAEVEHLIESSWYAVLETFILLAAFHQDLNVSFVTMITTLFILKSFHWLAADRIDYMERSPVITWVFHLRAICLCVLLTTIDLLFISYSWNSLMTRGPSVEVVFGLEFAIMLISAVNTFLRYCLHCLDLQNETPWQNKTIYIRYIDIVLGFLKLCMYVGYMAFMLWILFIPLHIARRIYITAKSFQKNLHDVVLSRQAIRNLNTLYPAATAEELNSGNNVCIICREEMTRDCKKLPCSHIFHTVCLRSWFQEQQSCPTCRMDILQNSGANPTQRQQRQRQQQARGRGGPGVPQQGRGREPGVVPPPPPPQAMFPGMIPPMWPHPPPQPHPQQPHPPPQQQAGQPRGAERSAQQEQQQGEETTPPTSSSSSDQAAPANASAPPPPPSMQGVPRHMMPPFFMPPFLPPFPPMPPFAGAAGVLSGEGLRGLSDEELRGLEGMERANVEARIAVLRRVQTLLDAAVLQLNQYSTVMATLGSTAGPGFPGYYPPPPPSSTVGPGFPGYYPSPPPPPSSTAATDDHPQPETNTVSSTAAAAETNRLFQASTKTGQTLLQSPPPSRTFSSSSSVPVQQDGKNLETEDRSVDHIQTVDITDGLSKPENVEGSNPYESSSSPAALLEPQLERERSEAWSSSDDAGLTFDPDRHVEMEVRQRRLQRFNSAPASPSSLEQPQSMAEALGEKGNESGDPTDDV